MRKQMWSVVTGAVIAPRCSVLLCFVILAFLAPACGSGSDNEAVGSTVSSETEPLTQTERPVPPEPESPTTVDPETTEPPPENGPPEPYLPGPNPEDRCSEIIDEATIAIEASAEPQTEAYAWRGLARLCVGQEAGADLEFAREHIDELSAETRDLLEAVIEMRSPKGEDLQEVLRERAGP